MLHRLCRLADDANKMLLLLLLLLILPFSFATRYLDRQQDGTITLDCKVTSIWSPRLYVDACTYLEVQKSFVSTVEFEPWTLNDAGPKSTRHLVMLYRTMGIFSVQVAKSISMWITLLTVRNDCLYNCTAFGDVLVNDYIFQETLQPLKTLLHAVELMLRQLVDVFWYFLTAARMLLLGMFYVLFYMPICILLMSGEVLVLLLQICGASLLFILAALLIISFWMGVAAVFAGGSGFHGYVNRLLCKAEAAVDQMDVASDPRIDGE